MRVIEVQTSNHQWRYVVVDPEGNLIEPAVRYLKHLDLRGAARNTLRSYAHMLRLYFEYVQQRGLDYRSPTIDDIAGFVHWLKLPYGSMKVAPVQPIRQARSNRTINHALTVVSGLYDYLWRIGDLPTNLRDKTTTYLQPRARQYKSFLHHLAEGSLVERHLLKQDEPTKRRPQSLSKGQVQQLIDACDNRRDQLLIHLLFESAMRIGECLALWIEDIDFEECRIYVRDRGQLENGAEIKTVISERSIDVTPELIDEIIAYVGIAHTVEVETNHLFIKMQGSHAGQPLTYADVNSLFRRLRSKTGLSVTPHILRHSMLTLLATLGWRPELLRERAGHASFQQTFQAYVHPPLEELRAEWKQVQHKIRLKTHPEKEEG
jgi:integrase/recombinase XerD